MARRRDYAREYQRRLERGQQRGFGRQAARGHRATPERPLGALRDPERYWRTIQARPDFYEALARTPMGRGALARVNQRRAKGALPPIEIGPPPDPSAGERQGTTDSWEEAERRVMGIPPDYARLYLHAGGITWAIKPAETRRRRRAA